MRINQHQALYLAGLLHDIGKFAQRADPQNRALDSNWLDQATKNMESDLCPTYKGVSTHKHVLWTAWFIEKYLSHVKVDVDGFHLGTVSARHHKTPQSLGEHERIVAFADKLSSGHDRSPLDMSDKQVDPEEKWVKDHFKKVRLKSIFSQLKDAKISSGSHSHDLMPYVLDDTLFPKAPNNSTESLQPDYEKLWKAFVLGVERLPFDNIDAFATSMLYLLQSYTWCIPSSTVDEPDVPLFDHLKTTGAIASCLSRSTETVGAVPDTFDALKSEDKNRFTLIAGDLSGIQSFIYQIRSKGAAKTLKGRSFYISLLMDALATEVLRAYGIHNGNILINSGGKFQILAPVDSEASNVCLNLVAAMNHELWKAFGGQISIGYSEVFMTASDLYDSERFKKVLSKSQDNLEREKSRRFVNDIKDTQNAFFEPKPLFNHTNAVCSVTGLDPVDDEVIAGGADWISRLARQQQDIGAKIRKAKYIVKVENSREIDLSGKIQIPGTGVSYVIIGESDGQLDQVLSRTEHVNRTVFSINGVQVSEWLPQNAGNRQPGRGWWLYGASNTPTDVSGDVLEFEDIAEDGVNDLLAVLRMDVDGLGKVFRGGFRDDIKSSIARISTLSNRLDWFFGGYLDKLIREEFDPSPDLTVGGVVRANKKIYPVYAGGDDVFIVTRWDLAPQLAKAIYIRFKDFTSGVLTLSSGIAVTDAKYPIHRGADESDRMESKAKQLPTYEIDGSGKRFEIPGGKDSITFFGETLSWPDFKLAEQFMLKSAQTMEKMGGNKTLLGLYRSIIDEIRDAKHRDSVYIPKERWRWRSAYRITRISKQYEIKSEDFAEIRAALFCGVFNGKHPQRTENNEMVDLLPMSARWLASLTRKPKG